MVVWPSVPRLGHPHAAGDELGHLEEDLGPGEALQLDQLLGLLNVVGGRGGLRLQLRHPGQLFLAGLQILLAAREHVSGPEEGGGGGDEDQDDDRSD